MGYLHINNLEKDWSILEFKKVFALEKIHGTSAHIAWVDNQLKFFSGGEAHERFVALFNQTALNAGFIEKFNTTSVIVYGEAYGGKQQGMSVVYGPNLKFVVFDVKINDSWLSVGQAESVAANLGLEFVDYNYISTSVEDLDRERDKPSVQAVRNGMGKDKMREGIVLRPPFEVTLNNGSRLIAKYKRLEFAERRTVKKLYDPQTHTEQQNAALVAFEWVTDERLRHVINRLISTRTNKEVCIEDTQNIIALMLEDVLREGSGEVLDTRQVRKAINSETVKLFKLYLKNQQAPCSMPNASNVSP
jgi:hypothetical protein